MADLAGSGWFIENAVCLGWGGGGKGVLGALFVVAAYSMAVSCFICAAVTFRSYRISPIISVAVLVAMALAAILWVSLRLVVLLLLPPTDLSYWLSFSKAFT